uniref:Uncharacterized protein n=1 Tax=Pipistrellus kuhlii TaxID=59472 RepID=A0A7J8A8H5_PIPKU|nr:hypothetical protein mPipKuh1_008921 [Pipistrellus kuhlii]
MLFCKYCIVKKVKNEYNFNFLYNYVQTRGLVHEFMHGWGPAAWLVIEAYQGPAGWGEGPWEVSWSVPPVPHQGQWEDQCAGEKDCGRGIGWPGRGRGHGRLPSCGERPWVGCGRVLTTRGQLLC